MTPHRRISVIEAWSEKERNWNVAEFQGVPSFSAFEALADLVVKPSAPQEYIIRVFFEGQPGT